MHVVVMGCVCQSLIKKLLTYLLTYLFMTHLVFFVKVHTVQSNLSHCWLDVISGVKSIARSQSAEDDRSAVSTGQLMVVGVLLLRVRRPGIRCQTVFMTQLWVLAFSSFSWKHFLNEILWYVVTPLEIFYWESGKRYINLHFTYLLTFLRVDRSPETYVIFCGTRQSPE